MLTRRSFLQTAAAIPAVAASQPKRIAMLATAYTPLSQAQHMGDRFLVGYPYGGVWRMPEAKLTSLYVEKKPEGELSGARAREFGFDVYSTVAGALRRGGKELAVDAVLIFDDAGEGGLFEQCLQVFEQERRGVPVYQDRQLAHSFEKARTMFERSRRLRFPVLGGTSLPVTWRLPAIDLPVGCRVEEALMVGVGEGREFHAIEGLQCMVERRRGGETGVKSVQLLEGDAVWKAGEAGRYSKELLISALSRSDTPLGFSDADSRPQNLVAAGQLQVLARHPAAYLIEYRDGLKAAVLMLDGAVKDFNFAARLSAPRQVLATQFLVTPEPNATHSACLTQKVEQLIAGGAAPYPAERALLVGGVLESCLTSKEREHGRLQTPHLKVAYQAPAEPQFAQA